MRQAGRYLPEYRAVRERVSFEELCRTPELCAEVTLQPIDRFDLDAAILFSDILTVFDAMGVEVRFNPSPVVVNPVRTVADAKRLVFGSAQDHLQYVFDAVRACKRALADRVPLIGFCGAPLTTASYLVEGGASKDFIEIKKLAFTEPAVLEGLLERITSLLVEYLRGQVEAGVDALQIFESWGSALAPADYRRYAFPHVQRLVREAKTFGVPVILFIRGNASLLRQAALCEPDVIGVDWGIELGEAIEVVGSDRVVQGNLDPIALLSTREAMAERARGIVEAGRAARAHIFNLGHGISRFTDPAMVEHLVSAVHGA